MRKSGALIGFVLNSKSEGVLFIDRIEFPEAF